MIAQRRMPHKEEAMFCVASSRPHVTFSVKRRYLTSATPEGLQDRLSRIGSISVARFPDLDHDMRTASIAAQIIGVGLIMSVRSSPETDHRRHHTFHRKRERTLKGIFHCGSLAPQNWFAPRIRLGDSAEFDISAGGTRLSSSSR
jgi:hypothetical protein